MKATITPGYLRGMVTAPPSKSHTQRVFAAALQHCGKTIVRGAGRSDDELAALGAITQLGAAVRQNDDIYEITSAGVRPVADIVNVGESGLAARLFAPIAAISGNRLQITGAGSLLKRPMDGLARVLPELGVILESFNGYLPFYVQGPLCARPVKVNATEGSQLLSGLLFALAAAATEPVTIDVAGLASRPYIDMTLGVLAHFGYAISRRGYDRFTVDPQRRERVETVEVSIEADWSSASCLLVAGAIAGEITIGGLNAASAQADRQIIDILKQAGADLTLDDGLVTVKKSRIRSFEYDATHTPDLFPALAILAAFGFGESAIRGVHRLFYKESNRVESITEMLLAFGVPFSVEDDTLFITGLPKLEATTIDSYGDHRIVMAAAAGALRAGNPVAITNCGVVTKSYPGFFDALQACGVRLQLSDDQ